MSKNTDMFDILWKRMDAKEKNHVWKKVKASADQVEKKKYRKESEEVLQFLNEKACKNFRPTPTNLDFIAQRLKDNITTDQLRAIIVRKCREWKGTEWEYCLRPATLFNRTKCEQYLGDLG